MTPRRKEKFLNVIRSRQPGLTVLMEDIHDPHNLSAVIRTCDSVGIMELFALFSDAKKGKLRLGKNSSSSARKWVDVRLFNNREKCLKTIRSKYDKIYCTHLSADAKPLYDLDLTGSVALVFGNERDGVSREMLDRCDGNFVIPQVGMIESLNVSVACAISLYEAFRQRQANEMYEKSAFSETEVAALFEDYKQRTSSDYEEITLYSDETD